MDPDQNTPTPEPQQSSETPMTPEVPAFQQNQQYVAPVESVPPVINNPTPVSYVQPEPETVAQPFVPIAPVEQPPVEDAPQQSATSSEVFGSTPQPANNNIAVQPKKSNTKLFIMIGVSIAALVIVGVVAWLLFFR